MVRGRVARASVIGLAVVAVALLALLLYPIASALLFAAVLAGSFHPRVKGFAKRLGGRPALASAITTVVVALVIVLPLTTLVIVLGGEAIEGVEYVRSSLKRYISYKHSSGQNILPAYLFTPDVEDTVRNAIRQTSAGSYLALDPNVARSVTLRHCARWDCRRDAGTGGPGVPRRLHTPCPADLGKRRLQPADDADAVRPVRRRRHRRHPLGGP